MSGSGYALAADLIVLVHVLYVAFVVLGEGAILLGAVLRWPGIRNFRFRALHLLAIGIVVFESLWGIVCPFTAWEARLRAAAGQPVEAASFLGRGLHRMLFIAAPEWAFTLGYCLFGALVLLTLAWVPPRWKRQA